MHSLKLLQPRKVVHRIGPWWVAWKGPVHLVARKLSKVSAPNSKSSRFYGNLVFQRMAAMFVFRITRKTSRCTPVMKWMPLTSAISSGATTSSPAASWSIHTYYVWLKSSWYQLPTSMQPGEVCPLAPSAIPFERSSTRCLIWPRGYTSCSDLVVSPFIRTLYWAWEGTWTTFPNQQSPVSFQVIQSTVECPCRVRCIQHSKYSKAWKMDSRNFHWALLAWLETTASEKSSSWSNDGDRGFWNLMTSRRWEEPDARMRW